MYSEKKLLNGVKKSWIKLLKPNLDSIINLLNLQNNNNIILPKIENTLETFKYFEIKETKLVLIGQDPYHNIVNNEPQASGLAFSVNKNIPIPPSLKNIFKELKLEYPNFNIPINGDLSRWVKNEKILLLNSSLTVKYNKPNSHNKIWEEYTNNIIKYISNNVNNVIFLLLGNFAKKKIKYINKEKILNNNIKIINSVHPSPLSANRGFYNSNIFIKCNEYLNLINCKKKLQISKINYINNELKLKIIFFIKTLEINWNLN